MTSQLGLDYTTMRHPDNVKTAQMKDNYNKEIDHCHQPTNTQNVIMHRKTITEVITGNRLRRTTIDPVLDVMKISNITGEDITRRHCHNEIIIRNTTTDITSPDINLITDKMTDKVTIVEGVTEVDHHAGACNPTGGRLEMIKAVIEHAKAIKRQIHIQDTLKMTNVKAVVTHAPMMWHALQVSAGHLP